MELVRSYGADVVVPRGDRFGSAVRTEAPGGVDALFDTAVLGRDSFPAIRDGGAYVPVRGWDASPSERDIRIRAVMVMEALTRTDWLNELRDLASSGAITLRVAGEYPPQRAADPPGAGRAPPPAAACRRRPPRMEAGGLRGRAVIVF